MHSPSIQIAQVARCSVAGAHSVQENATPFILMLEIIATILIIGWLLGMVSSYTLGGFIHILLVIAIVLILVRVIRGRPPV
jgi:hypothetical protein